MLDLAINNGTIINADGRTRANVGVLGGRIVTLTEELLNARKVIDASGQWVLPGVIDAHAHFDLIQGQGEQADRTCDDYTSGPMSAALGGVTTFIDFAIQKQGQPALQELQSRMARAGEQSCIDFAFHVGLTNANQQTLAEIAKMFELGVTSFKVFLTYKKWGFGIDLGFLAEVMREIAPRGGIVCVHGENDELVEFYRAHYHRLGHREMIYHSLSRPAFSEEIAFLDTLVLTREIGCPTYFVHVSTARGLDVITRFRNEGVTVFAETCPHYLAFDDKAYQREDGVLYTMTPPLRPEGNKEALWRGVVNGQIDIVASDHNSFSQELKYKAEGFFDVAPGVSGTAFLFPYLFTYGVAEKRISPERLVMLLSANPARIYGLPNKGAIAVGRDADLIVLDPEEEFTVYAKDFSMGRGYTLFEGWKMKGRPRFTISRGECVAKQGRFVGRHGRGRFVRRTAFSCIEQRTKETGSCS